jgi:hypothetical protein
MENLAETYITSGFDNLKNTNHDLPQEIHIKKVPFYTRGENMNGNRPRHSGKYYFVM